MVLRDQRVAQREDHARWAPEARSTSSVRALGAGWGDGICHAASEEAATPRRRGEEPCRCDGSSHVRRERRDRGEGRASDRRGPTPSFLRPKLAPAFPSCGARWERPRRSSAPTAVRPRAALGECATFPGRALCADGPTGPLLVDECPSCAACQSPSLTSSTDAVPSFLCVALVDSASCKSWHRAI